jgi:arylsulfatase B/arylsulfatase I/J
MFIDDLGWNDIGFHGGSGFPTPNIDALRHDGLELDNYYVQPLCSPSRAALLSGKYPINVGMQSGALEPAAQYGLPLSRTLLPQELKRAGYTTHLVGKWHLGFCETAYQPNERGFDTFLGYYNHGEFYYDKVLTFDRPDDEFAAISGLDLRLDEQPIWTYEYSTYLYGNETIDILDWHASNYNNNVTNSNESSADPFFIYLSFQAVHTPLAAPQHIIDSFDFPNMARRKMAAVATVLDDVIGEIADHLQSTVVDDDGATIWDNTLVVFSTDNGGDQTGVNGGNNFPLRGSKGTLWEGAIRGAGFVTGGWLPDKRRGRNMKALMHLTDWYPTLCKIAGVSSPLLSGDLDGFDQSKNLQNNMRGPQMYQPRKEVLLNIDPVDCQSSVGICGALRFRQFKLMTDNSGVNGAPCRNDWCPVDPPQPSENASIQCSSSGSIYDYPLPTASDCSYNQRPCLFDVVSDPCEHTDLLAADPVTYERIYRSLLAKLQIYNDTQATPLVLLPGNEADIPAADPLNFAGYWSAFK